MLHELFLLKKCQEHFFSYQQQYIWVIILFVMNATLKIHLAGGNYVYIKVYF